MSRSMINRSIAILDALNAKYHVALPDGKVYANVGIDAPKRRSKRKKTWGLMSKHYLPYVKSIKRGELLEVPYSQFSGKPLASSISAYGRYLYGKGKILTCRNDKRKVIEMMRV